MKIAEIFHSIQGEGSLMGTPSIFIRTSGCDLRCSWCDSPYTSWKPEGDTMSVDEILGRLGLYPDCPYVVITGGEPMLYKSEMVKLTKALFRKDCHVTIETTGRHYINFADLRCHLMSMSPKLRSSTPRGLNHAKGVVTWGKLHEKKRWDMKSQANFKLNLKAFDYQVKFVVCEMADIEEIQAMAINFNLDRHRVYLMPEGRTAEEIQDKAGWVVDLCKENGFRYSPRLHIDIWGNKRGV